MQQVFHLITCITYFTKERNKECFTNANMTEGTYFRTKAEFEELNLSVFPVIK